MTALNGIILPDGAHLLTDGAVYDRHSRVKGIGSKVLNFERQKLAIGWAGFGRAAMIRWGLRLARANSQSEILTALPAVARKIVHFNSAIASSSEAEMRGLRLMVALWDLEQDEPQLWSLHSDNALLGPRYEPYTLIRIHRHLDVEPGMEMQAIGRQLTTWRDFKPERDGLALLEHQRREPWDDGSYCVGGFAELTTVTRDGVESKVLRHWPDKVGKRIVPELV